MHQKVIGEDVLVFRKSEFGGLRPELFRKEETQRLLQRAKMDSERYAFNGELHTGAEPETSPNKIPSITTRPKGIAFKLGSFIFT